MPRPAQINAATLAQGDKSPGHGAVQSDSIQAHVDTRVPDIKYPLTAQGSYYNTVGQAPESIKIVDAGGTNVKVSTVPGYGTGIQDEAGTRTTYSNPEPTSDAQSNP